MGNGKDVQKWADEAMFEAEAMPFDVNKSGPRVTLLQAPTDPLGAIAAMSMMYEGKVVRSLSDVTDDQRRHYLEQITRTHLKAPFESVQFHFLIEGVTRSFTHQMVRQRTACYAQESLRFAVKDGIDEEVALPPSLRSLPDDAPEVVLWRKAVNSVDDAYSALVNAGIPAEDARGLLPHNITTRLHYVTNLRGLLEHAGNRLCTQAQFEWRLVFTRLVEAIRNYDPQRAGMERHKTMEFRSEGPVAETLDRWQFDALAGLFKPICYMTGKCEFKADFDRACSIRDRVEANAAIGRPSSKWHLPVLDTFPEGLEGEPVKGINGIDPSEWLMDPEAAR